MMKKMMFAAVAALSLVLPQINAQDTESESENDAETSETQKTSEKRKSGKRAAKAPDPDKAAEETEKTEPTVFSKQQDKIRQLTEKLKKAKKNAEKRRLSEALKLEQNKLRMLLAQKTKPLKEEIPRLKEQIRLSGPNRKKELEAKIAAREEKIKKLEADADTEKWCAEVSAPAGDAKKGPDIGTDSKKKKKKSKTSKSKNKKKK